MSRCKVYLLGHCTMHSVTLYSRINPSDRNSPTRPRVGDITVFNLLTFTAGNAYPVADLLSTLDADTLLVNPNPFFPSNKSMYVGPHDSDPTSKWQYGAEFDYIGLLVEKLTSTSLGNFIQTNILSPAGVDPKDFTFSRDAEQIARSVGQHARVSASLIVPRGPIYDHANIQLESAGTGGFGTINALAQALLPIINNGIHR
jgi:methyl acetate hydrolase